MQKIVLAIVLSIAQVCVGVAASAPLKSIGVAAGPTLFELPVIPSLDNTDPRDETSIAVSPKNDQIIVGASKLIDGGGTAGRGNTRVAYYYSSNAGQTWGNSVLTLETPEKTWGRASDPSVAADLEGNFYLCALMLDNTNFDSSVYVFKSTDGGQTFGDPRLVTIDVGNPMPRLIDKCYVTVDTSPTSPFKNTIYAVWVVKEVQPISLQDLSVIKSAHLRPGETHFSQPKSVGHSGDMRGPSLAIGPNGEFCTAWLGMPARVLLFNASTDGGETFLPNVIDLNIHSYVGSLDAPNAVLSIRGVPRMNSFPVIDVDRSSGPNRGAMYVAWAETTNRVDADVFVKRLQLTNNGVIKGSPVRVNNNRGGDQFFPWLSVDSTTGAVNVVFFESEDDVTGRFINMQLAQSTDGAASFSDSIRVNAVGSDPRVQASVLGGSSAAIGIGDYVGVSAARGKAHVLWPDSRRGRQEIFYGQVDFGSSGGGGGGGGGGGPANDACSSPRAIQSLPFLEDSDTGAATSSAEDPVSCSGASDSASVWYSFTANSNTVLGVDTSGSDYDTVLSIYTGVCGSLAGVACSDDFGGSISPANRSLLTFAATAGVTYLIEVSGKGSGGNLRLRLGYPTVTAIEYTEGPDGSESLKITGAGFVNNDAVVTVNKSGDDNQLPTTFFSGAQQGDGTFTTIFGTKKKLKKIVKKRKTVIVRVESPAGSGRVSIPFSFTR
ncbi:MAG: hypothetical protein AABO41_27695 [Acidobacteriota bacterium]